MIEIKDLKDMTDEEWDAFMDKAFDEYFKKYGTHFVDDLNKEEAVESQ